MGKQHVAMPAPQVTYWIKQLVMLVKIIVWIIVYQSKTKIMELMSGFYGF